VEGGPDSDWAVWEHEGRLRARHERCGEATGHARHWESDFDRIASVGANAYRFSLEWSRVEPEPGRFDEGELSRFRLRLERLRALGIEPVVTLSHYTHPRWFWRHGWETASGVAAFLRFVRAAAEAAGPLVSIWTIFNEPMVFVLGGYLDGSIPPGRRNFALAGEALEGILRAHAEAAGILREANPAASLGFAHNMMSFSAARDEHLPDRALARAADRLYNRALIEAMATGEMDFRIPWIGRRKFRVENLPRTVDFVGVNYYSRLHLRFPGRDRLAGDFFYLDRGGRGLTDTGWEVHPDGLEACLRIAAEPGLPVIVTENGIATDSDRLRCDFLREHVAVLAHVRRSGLDLRGYFYWSLLDNFEWLEGFAPRFGLFEVDYATHARRRRPSADLFRDLSATFLRRNFTGA
jgi:beta-glucosidase